MDQVGPVRRAEARDADALVRLRAEMFAAMGVDDSPHWRDRARKWFTDRIDHRDYGMFVLDDDGDVVACAVGAVRDAAPSPAVPDGRDVLISNVCVLPSHRGRGCGRQVFDAVMDWARQSGVGRAELMATDAGRSMYEREGFEPNAHPAMRATLSPEAPTAPSAELPHDPNVGE